MYKYCPPFGGILFYKYLKKNAGQGIGEEKVVIEDCDGIRLSYMLYLSIYLDFSFNTFYNKIINW